MRWTFDGVLLPGGHDGRLEVGDGDLQQALPGRYALPGLVDAHAHLTVRPDHTLGDEMLARRRLEEYAAAGVTTVRDVGGRSEVTLPLASCPEPGRPTVVAAGRFLSLPGRYFPRMHQPVAAADLLDAAAAEIAAGATWLKLIGDFPHLGEDGGFVPGSTDPTYPLATVEDLVDLAHERGVRVAAHTQSKHVEALVQAGIDSVEHGDWLMEEAVYALGARGGAWTPTLTAITRMEPDASATRRSHVAEVAERLRDLLPRAVAAGVHVLAGTDNAGSLADEIALLARHGLTPEQALIAGSTEAAWLGAGPPATDSLVTYDSDPREDPETLAAPVAVVVRGRRVR